jgi:hypothetical protein
VHALGVLTCAVACCAALHRSDADKVSVGPGAVLKRQSSTTPAADNSAAQQLLRTSAGCRASRRLCSVYTRAGFLSQILLRQLALVTRHPSQDQMGSNGAGSSALWRVGVRDVTVPLVQLETTAAHLR